MDVVAAKAVTPLRSGKPSMKDAPATPHTAIKTDASVVQPHGLSDHDS